MNNSEKTTACNTNENENPADEEHPLVTVQKGEGTIYEEVHAYLSRGCYPLKATKQEKGIIRKRSKNYQLLEGVLHYKENGDSLRQVH